jgi:hypothetical protein
VPAVINDLGDIGILTIHIQGVFRWNHRFRVQKLPSFYFYVISPHAFMRPGFWSSSGHNPQEWARFRTTFVALHGVAAAGERLQKLIHQLTC